MSLPFQFQVFVYFIIWGVSLWIESMDLVYGEEGKRQKIQEK